MRRRPRPLLLSLAAAVVLVACSSQLRYQVLSTVFDGVLPDAVGPDEDGAEDGGGPTGLEVSSDGRPQPSVHAPFAQNDCKACHDLGPPSLLRASPQTFCLDCHDDQTAPDPTRGFEWLHGPVAAVDCLRCHNAHDSRQPHLLKNPGVALCTQCHTEKVVTSEQKAAGRSPPPWPLCTDCHQPHGAETHALLKGRILGLLQAGPGAEADARPPPTTAQDPLCVDCHDGRTAPSPTAGLDWVHGPVAAGECVSCHEPHHPTSRPTFLRFTGDALCTQCHEAFAIPSGSHAQIGGKGCLDCHGAHGEKR